MYDIGTSPTCPALSSNGEPCAYKRMDRCGSYSSKRGTLAAAFPFFFRVHNTLYVNISLPPFTVASTSTRALIIQNQKAYFHDVFLVFHSDIILMSLSPSKSRNLSRQPSTPSLAVGLPPALPESNIMTPSTSSRSDDKTHLTPRTHRGDVSSVSSSSNGSIDDIEPVGLPSPVRSALSTETTPKRRVIGIIEPVSAGRQDSGRKRDTLTARLQEAARVKKSKSAGDSLHSATSVLGPSFVTGPESGPKTQLQDSPNRNMTVHGNDKVVVCVRSVRI